MENTTPFPIRIKLSAKAIEELHGCEYGSFEDHIAYPGEKHHALDQWPDQHSDDGSRVGEYADGTLHCCEIIERHKTVIRIDNQAECDEVYAQASTGTFSIFCLQAARKIFWTLRPHVSSTVRNSWIKEPNGY